MPMDVENVIKLNTKLSFCGFLDNRKEGRTLFKAILFIVYVGTNNGKRPKSRALLMSAMNPLRTSWQLGRMNCVGRKKP